jgi:hypothetical protein
MSSTGPLPDNDTCGPFCGCDLLEYDDSKCKDICKCCVGISDYGDHNKCTSACRKCRNFGTTWEPRRPMKPLCYSTIQTDLPGYATTGEFVKENFVGGGNLLGTGCIIKTFLITCILLYLATTITGKKMDTNKLLMLAGLAVLGKCLLPRIL